MRQRQEASAQEKDSSVAARLEVEKATKVAALVDAGQSLTRRSDERAHQRDLTAQIKSQINARSKVLRAAGGGFAVPVPGSEWSGSRPHSVC